MKKLPTMDEVVEDNERKTISKALNLADGDISQAARALNLNEKELQQKIMEYGVSPSLRAQLAGFERQLIETALIQTKNELDAAKFLNLDTERFHKLLYVRHITIKKAVAKSSSDTQSAMSPLAPGAYKQILDAKKCDLVQEALLFSDNLQEAADLLQIKLYRLEQLMQKYNLEPSPPEKPLDKFSLAASPL